MRPIYILSLLAVLTVVSGCKDKVQGFYRQTDVVKDGLKGKVKSVVMHHCLLDSSAEYCSVFLSRYNERGFLTESIDTSEDLTFSYKFFYNGDGLLAKLVFKAVFLSPEKLPYFIPPWEQTYTYSFSERKRTKIFRQNASGKISVDTIVTIYDKNGNEIQDNSKTVRSYNEYDEHGFLVLERHTFLTDSQRTSEVHYINDAGGRPVKITWSDGSLQTFVYNKNGNSIQQVLLDKSDTLSYNLIGYCEFDINGNYLKKINTDPLARRTYLDTRVIEYY